MARLAFSPSRRSNLIARYGKAVVDDGFFELRQEDGDTWPFCTLCKCWTNAHHVQGKKHTKKREWRLDADFEEQAANNAAGQVMAIEDAPALVVEPGDGVPAPPPAQLPELHQQLKDLGDLQDQTAGHIVNLQAQVAELQQVAKQLVQQMARVNAVVPINDSGAAASTSAESSGGSSEQRVMPLRLRGNASN